MFTELSQLINKANLKKLSLSIQNVGNGNIAVVVMTENNIGDAADPKLRAALSQALKLQASPGILDEQFITHLNAYSQSYVDATVKANTTKATESMDTASAAAHSVTSTNEKSTPVEDALGEGGDNADTNENQSTFDALDLD